MMPVSGRCILHKWANSTNVNVHTGTTSPVKLEAAGNHKCVGEFLSYVCYKETVVLGAAAGAAGK